MDNLTHTFVGLFLSRAGFRRFTPQATVIMMVAANAPDFDVATWFIDRPAWLHWHRHITHSLLAVPLMAILSVLLVRVLSRRQVRWLPAFLISMVAVASHILLDMTNVYGVRLLLPFSAQWFSWDMTPVVDLVIWAILFLGLAVPVLGRLVGSEIGERQTVHRGGGAAIAALLFLTAYNGSRVFFHQRAMQTLSGQLIARETPRRLAAFPGGNPLVWTGLAELSNSWAELPVDLREQRLHFSEMQTIYKAEPSSAIEATRNERPFRILNEFVQYPLWTVEPAPDDADAKQVTLLDLRFGQPVAPGFASARAIVDALNRVKSTSFGVGPASLRPR